MQNINKTVVKATKWSMLAEIFAKLVSPVTNMILARLLVPAAFGAVATITMVTSFADLFTDAGFQKYIVQHEFENDDELYKSVNVAFWSNLLLSALFVLGICLLRKPLAELVGSPELSAGIAVSSVSILLSSFSSIQTAVYKRKFDFKTLFAVRMVTCFIPLVVTVPLAIVLRNYWALIFGTITMNVAQAIILTVRSEWKPKIYYSWKRFLEMFSFTAWTLLESVSIWLTSYIGTFIVGRKLDEYYLGIYKTSMTTVNAYMGIITAGIIPVLFSALSRYQNDDKLFKSTYFGFQKAVAIFLMPMGVGLYMYRELAVNILLGKNWGEASGFIGLWSLVSAVVIIISYFTSEVYRSKGKPQVSLFTQLLHLAFLIPTIIISVNYSFKALYISRSLIRIQSLVTSVLIMQFMFKISFLETLKNILPQTVSAILMGILAFFIKDLFPGMVWQFASVIICGIAYFAILMIFPGMRNEILRIVKNKRLI